MALLRFAAVWFLLFLPGMAWAQGGVQQSGPVVAGHQACWAYNGYVNDCGSGANVISLPQVANNTALKNLTAGAYSTVYRAGFTTAGDGGGAVYTWAISPCSLNSGAGDNGSQVSPNSGTGCWIASFGPSGASVLAFGADPTGAMDSEPAFLAAQVAGKVIVPCGTYLLNSAFTATADDMGGWSSACSILKVSFATGDAITFTTAHGSFHDFQFASSVTRTGGSYLTMNSIYQNVQRVYQTGAAIGIYATENSSVGVIRDTQCIDPVSSSTYSKSTCILVGGPDYGVESLYIDNPLCSFSGSMTNHPRSCIELVNTDALVINNPTLIYGVSGILVDPGTGTGGVAENVSSTQIIGGFLDTSNSHDLEFSPTGNGSVGRFTVTGTWFGDSVGDGIYFNSSSSNTTAGFYCVNCYGLNNGTWFANIASSQWSNINFSGGCVVGNGTGNFVGVANVQVVTINNVSQDQTACSYNPSPIGVQIASGSSKWNVTENDFTGVTTPISGASNLLSGMIVGNTAYNPVGNVSVTRPASGATFYNGPTPATLFVTGGTISSIVLSGTATGLTSGSFPLAPFQGITVTYSAPPNFTLQVQ